MSHKLTDFLSVFNLFLTTNQMYRPPTNKNFEDQKF